MFRTPATSRLALVCAASALFCAGCFDTSSDIITLTYPTLLTVDPLLFRGNVSCGSPGLVRYVVTLEDVTDRRNIVTLPSSVPVPCQSPISYGEGKIFADHFYSAIIEGYDREVHASDGADPRQMYDASGNPVSPAWTTLCGDDTPFDPDASFDPNTYDPLRNPTVVVPNTENVVRGCAAFAPLRPQDAAAPDSATPGDSGTSSDGAPRDGVLDMSADNQPPRDGGADTASDASDAAVDSPDATTSDAEIDAPADAASDPNVDAEPPIDALDATIDVSDAEIDVPADAPSDDGGLDADDVRGDEGGNEEGGGEEGGGTG
jgi:hypothetical protein